MRKHGLIKYKPELERFDPDEIDATVTIAIDRRKKAGEGGSILPEDLAPLVLNYLLQEKQPVETIRMYEQDGQVIATQWINPPAVAAPPSPVPDPSLGRVRKQLTPIARTETLKARIARILRFCPLHEAKYAKEYHDFECRRHSPGIRDFSNAPIHPYFSGD